jgi:hypothetical protein
MDGRVSHRPSFSDTARTMIKIFRLNISCFVEGIKDVSQDSEIVVCGSGDLRTICVCAEKSLIGTEADVTVAGERQVRKVSRVAVNNIAHVCDVDFLDIDGLVAAGVVVFEPEVPGVAPETPLETV